MSRPALRTLSTAVALTLGVAASPAAFAYGHAFTYRVTIVNVTPASQFTPVLVAVHRPDVGVFELGEAGSEELAILAESGDTAPLAGVLGGVAEVSSVTSVPGPENGLTFAGETVEFEIEASPYREVLSIAAMILPTNDSFVGLDSVRLPRYGSRTYAAIGYDAGSEANDERCANIPGPTCGEDGGSPEGEGFVHVSSGMHGIGDLPREIYDWRNPVASVTIERIR